MQLWLDHGADPKKLTLGLPLYGHSYTLEDAKDNGVGANTTGAGTPGPFTREAGTLGYAEVSCEL